MKTLAIEVPEILANKLKGLVEAGWFASEDEIGRLALAEFVSRHRFELQEQFQRDDIAWALSQTTRGKSG
jgi:Arc/MetJ-type ribon-helix-helix transcriptional regulator